MCNEVLNKIKEIEPYFAKVAKQRIEEDSYLRKMSTVTFLSDYYQSKNSFAPSQFVTYVFDRKNHNVLKYEPYEDISCFPLPIQCNITQPIYQLQSFNDPIKHFSTIIKELANSIIKMENTAFIDFMFTLATDHLSPTVYDFIEDDYKCIIAAPGKDIDISLLEKFSPVILRSNLIEKNEIIAIKKSAYIQLFTEKIRSMINIDHKTQDVFFSLSTCFHNIRFGYTSGLEPPYKLPLIRRMTINTIPKNINSMPIQELQINKEDKKSRIFKATMEYNIMLDL